MGKNKNKRVFILLVCLLVTGMYSCTKEKDFLYQVNTVQVQSTGSGKNTAKSTTEFITIAWADLFSSQIPQQQLLKWSVLYDAFGDKKLIEDRILLNMLSVSGSVIPAVPSVNGDTAEFIQQTYKRLYNRDADAFEVYYLKEQIRLNPAFTPRVVWYSLMTSDEYRYY
jgi:hypothetical protein